MKAVSVITLITAIAIGVTIIYAMPQSYQVNINFIPALITGSCTVGQFWSPQNMTCTMCFCLTGRISRCVPQPGCTPSANSTTTTTTSTTSTTVASDAVSSGSSTPASMSPTTAATTTTTKPAVVKVRRHAKVETSRFQNY